MWSEVLNVAVMDSGFHGNCLHDTHGLHRLEKYLNIQDCLEKSMKIKFALKST